MSTLSFMLVAIAAQSLGGATTSSTECASFESYQPNQMLPPVVKVGALTISSVPANPIKIYDPGDDELKGAKGATMADTLMFETEQSNFRKFKLYWMSFTPGYTSLTATNGQGVVVHQAKLDGNKQKQSLSYSARGKGVSRLILQNAGKESIVTKVCFHR